ncbi:MAG: SufE family protein [Bdellovibrionales bacterium]|nr:SufE family protein [Bdellovibrionales bacterium]
MSNQSALPQQLQSLLDEFEHIDDREMHAELLIEFADRFSPVPKHVCPRPYPKERLVPGCESEAYAWLEPEGNGWRPYFAVENPHGISAQALAVILDEGLSGCSLADYAAVPEDLVYTIFGRNLSMGKGQGLMGMISALKELARRAQEHEVAR